MKPLCGQCNKEMKLQLVPDGSGEKEWDCPNHPAIDTDGLSPKMPDIPWRPIIEDEPILEEDEERGITMCSKCGKEFNLDKEGGETSTGPVCGACTPKEAIHTS